MSIFAKTSHSLTKEQINEYICPILLACSVYFASLYTFNKPSAYILTAVYAFLSIRIFSFFDKLRTRKSGAFIYALILALVLFISFALVMIHAANYGYYSPMRWFYAQDDSDVFEPLLTAALALGGGFFLTSIIYYFTVIRYRTMGVMLCTMFPFFFFAKRSDIMPNILITLIMLMFLAVIIHSKRIKGNEKQKNPNKLKIDRAYIICIFVFILITGAVTMAAEKPYYEAFLEKNSKLFTPFTFGAANSSGFEELSEQSSPRNARPEYSYEPLFYMKTDSQQEEIFLRMKAFDIFNGDVWENTEQDSWSFFSRQNPEYSTDDIASDISALTGAKPEELYSVRAGQISAEEFTPVYLPSPYGIITDRESAYSLIYYKLMSDTTVFRTMSYYYIPPLNDSFTFYEQSSRLKSFAHELNFSADEYKSYLSSFKDSENAKRLSEDYSKALNNYTDTSNISKKLADFSLQLVSDCHSDIEKAEKLERYFTENGYIYSLSYVPQDNSVDYFVFESKTGYCAGYATAMTLMARAVGLPARYVEGFAAFEKDEEGKLVIRDGYAHAFVEIYIPGAGWMTFDPTVSDYRSLPDSSGIKNGLGFLTRIFEALNRVSVIIIIAAAVLIFSLFDRIRELFVRLSLYSKPLDKRIITLYANMVRTVGASAGRSLAAYTPDMMRNYLTESRGVVPEKLISLFEKTAFGGYRCTAKEYKLAYREYKKCYGLLRNMKKKRAEKK